MRRPRRDPRAFHADLETVSYADGSVLTTVRLRLDDEIIRYANFTDRSAAEAFARRAKLRVSRGRGLVALRTDRGDTITCYLDVEEKL
jgi:hypothetical protein